MGIKTLPFTYRTIEDKKIRECRFQVQPGDVFAIMSDGCIYCGMGDLMNYKWDWKAVAECCGDAASATRTAAQLAEKVTPAWICMAVCAVMIQTVAVARIGQDRAVRF
ncbi:MAG: hypothetical protein V8R80_07690 [Eubacterium sp.]